MSDKVKVKELMKRYRVPSVGGFKLSRIDPAEPWGLDDKDEAKAQVLEMQERLADLQEVLYAGAQRALLVVLQAMDTGGKDSTIRHVFGPLNPQGVRVTSFKAPTSVELAHDYLWRIHRAVPPQGMIGIFNRSHYEDVLIVRVHELAPKSEIAKRYGQINAFEKYLAQNRVTVLKFYLHIDKDEQKERLQSRLDRPDKHWKFNVDDLAERKLWRRYAGAYEKMLNECSTRHAPWYVIPANRKWYRDWVITRIVLDTMRDMDLRYPDAESGLDEVVIES